MNRIRLATIVPAPNDSTSMLRAMMPLGLLAREHPELELIQHASWGWQQMCQCDAVFLQRPYTQDHFNLCLMAKELGLPVWLEYDDALDLLPPSNPNWSESAVKDIRNVIGNCLQLADAVSVTTAALRDHLREMLEKLRALGAKPALAADDILVIPNAHNDYVLDFADVARWPRRKTVVWRGSPTHDEDLLTVIRPLYDVAKLPAFADWTFHFLGEPCWQMRNLPRAKFSTDWKNYFGYMNELGSLCPAIQIVPLADNRFNRCKSNLAWLEASAAGAVCLAPDFPEFQKPGVVKYQGESDFREKLSDLMAAFSQPKQPKLVDGQNAKGCVVRSRRDIADNLLLSRVNQGRWELLAKLCGAKLSAANSVLSLRSPLRKEFQ